MSDTKNDPIRSGKFDRPSENLVTKNTRDAPWHDDDCGNANDKSQHRRHHSLFEDLMN